MLVLSRRPGQEIVFPALSIKIRLVKTEGSTARLAIEAPRHVAVFRAELIPEDGQAPVLSPEARAAAHELCNRLSKITLSLHLFEKLWNARREEEAASVLAEIMSHLPGLNRECVVRSVAALPQSKAPACRALVVDDDRNERELLAGLLSMNGCQCLTAGDGEDALARLASDEERPHFVLLDNWMPRLDGKQTLQAIRRDGRYRGLKVFSISPTPPEELGVSRGPDGFDAWFPKPLDPGQLWQTMQQHMAEAAAH